MDLGAGNSKAVIRIRDLWKSFEDVAVHQGLSLSVREGEIMTVIGASGGGKSVLLKEIIGLIRPDAGEIYVGTDEITQMSEKEIMRVRRKVGMLFQGSALFDGMNVFDNVAYGLRERRRLSQKELAEAVAMNLERVGLPGSEQMMPEELSGGMKKRVGLARALASEPEIILYDEPTTGLDPTAANRICELIRDLTDTLNVTSVMVTHDMHSIRAITDRMAMLYDGRIVATGTWDEMEASENEIIRQFMEGDLHQAPESKGRAHREGRR